MRFLRDLGVLGGFPNAPASRLRIVFTLDGRHLFCQTPAPFLRDSTYKHWETWRCINSRESASPPQLLFSVHALSLAATRGRPMKRPRQPLRVPPGRNPATDIIAKAAADFLDAVLKGDTQRASARLTPQAMQRIIASGKQFAPPGLETATFQIGRVRTPAHGQAIVQCVLTDAVAGDSPRSEEMCCLMRLVDSDWRVSGIAYGTGPNQPWMLSDFESGQTTAIPRQPSAPGTNCNSAPHGPGTDHSRPQVVPSSPTVRQASFTVCSQISLNLGEIRLLERFRRSLTPAAATAPRGHSATTAGQHKSPVLSGILNPKKFSYSIRTWWLVEATIIGSDIEHSAEYGKEVFADWVVCDDRRSLFWYAGC